MEETKCSFFRKKERGRWTSSLFLRIVGVNMSLVCRLDKICHPMQIVKQLLASQNTFYTYITVSTNTNNELFNKNNNPQVLICDALNLPYRDESFDAALSIAVIQLRSILYIYSLIQQVETTPNCLSLTWGNNTLSNYRFFCLFFCHLVVTWPQGIVAWGHCGNLPESCG